MLRNREITTFLVDIRIAGLLSPERFSGKQWNRKMDEKARKFGVMRAIENKENGQSCPMSCRKQSNKHNSLRSKLDLLYIVITDYVF